MLVLGALLFILALLWILLPFLVMGTNSRLDKTNKKLDKLETLLKSRLETPDEEYTINRE